MRKHRLAAIFAAITMGFASLASCNKPDEPVEKEVPVAGITLSQTSVELVAGGSVSISAAVTPSNATDKTVTWSSSAADVVSVSEGTITAIKPGTAVVTAKAGGKSATCNVTVLKKTVAVESVSLDKTELSLVEGESASLTAAVLPENATDRSVSWKSSDEVIATVDAQGKVSALKAGTATITVTTTDGGKTAQCRLTVEPEKIKEMVMVPSSLSMKEGETYQLEVRTPSGEVVKDVIWSSSNNQVAKIDENGLVTAQEPGKARIHANLKADENVTASCEITVEQDRKLKGISLSIEALDMCVGERKTLTVVYNPSYAENTNVAWTSSDDSVVSVDDGTLSARKLGTATITVTSEEGGFTASCAVTVVMSPAKSGIYWLDDNRFMGFNDAYIEGEDHLYSSGGLFIDGNDIYTLKSNYIPLRGYGIGLFKNGVQIEHEEIHRILESYYNQYIQYDFLRIVNGKAYMLASVRACSFIRLTTIDLATGKVEEKEFLPEKPYSSYGTGETKMEVTADGTVYILSQFKDEFKDESVRLWKIGQGGKVDETILYKEEGTISTVFVQDLAINEAGDVFCAVLTSTSTGTGYKYESHILKNGTELRKFEVGMLEANMAVSGNDVYFVYSNFDRSELYYYKNSDHLFTLKGGTLWIGDYHSLVVSSAGDIYSVVRGDREAWIYKNQTAIYYRNHYLNNIWFVE